jgi:hypothetical protein
MKLFLDDVRMPSLHGEWTIARSVQEAQRILENNTEPVTNMSLDHDLGYIYCRTCALREASGDPDESCGDWLSGKFTCGCPCHVEAPNGMDFLKWIQATGRWPQYRPVVHSANRPAAQRMEHFINDYGPYAHPSSR